MFTAIVRFSIKKKLFVGLTTLFLFIGGIYAMLTLPRATRGGTTHHYAYRNSDEQYYECRRYPFCQPLRAIGRNGRF